MRTYRVVYRLHDGSYHTQDIMAANKVAAYEIFETFGITGIEAINCFLMPEGVDC